GKFFYISIVRHFFIKIFKYGRPFIIFRVMGVIYMKVFYGNRFWHITVVAKIMLPGVGASNYIGTVGFAPFGHKNTIADHYFSLPGTTIIPSQIDQGFAPDGTVLNGQDTTANGIDSHMAKGRV